MVIILANCHKGYLVPMESLQNHTLLARGGKGLVMDRPLM